MIPQCCSMLNYSLSTQQQLNLLLESDGESQLNSKYRKERTKLRERIPHIGPIPIVNIPLKIFLDLLRVACVAWRFWLGALSNKGGRGQRNREEIGAGAIWKTACTDGGLFWVDPYASVRIVSIGSECLPVNQIFWYLPWKSFKGLKKSSPQNKIKISKKRWPERRRSWIFDGETEKLFWSLNRKRPFTVFLKGEMSWKFCQQVLARAWSLLSLLWPKKKYPHRKPAWSQLPL